MEGISRIIRSLLVLCFVIVIHEGGHATLAYKNNIEINQMSTAIATVNMIPSFLLDGGRVFFMHLENYSFQNIIMYELLSVLLLIVLVFFALFMDIKK